MTIGVKVVSWNIKDFGLYDYTLTWQLMVKLLSTADVVMILEVACNRAVKTMAIDSAGTRTAAFNAVEQLRSFLDKNDSGSDWSAWITGVNAGSPKRDAYAFLWKESPATSKHPSGLPTPPSAIALTLGTQPEILTNSSMTFPDRRPGLANFTFTDSGGLSRNFPFVAFHASVPVNSKSAAQSMNALGNTAEIVNAADIVIGGDFNMDFNKQIAFYKSFNQTFGLVNCLGDVNTANSGVQTSLSSTWNGVANYLSSAYDNFFIKGGNVAKHKSYSINVVEEFAKATYTKGPQAQWLYSAWKTLYPKHQNKSPFSGVHSQVPSATSDHLPVVLEVALS